MPIHLDWDRTGLPAIPHEYRGPLIAFALALALALVARFMRSGLLAAAAGAAGVVGGWYAITGRLWVTSPRPTADHLALVAAVTLVIGVLCARLDRNRGTLAGLLLAAAFTGWWLCGAPRNRPDLLQDWPIGLGVGVAVALYVRSLATVTTPDALRLTPLRLALTGLAMAASFHIVMLPPIWMQLALVPALASLALFALPAVPGLAALPIAADIAAVGSLAVINVGRLPRLRVGAVDVAAVAPLLALWLVPHLAGRLRFAGRAASVSASVLAALIATGAVWIALRALGH
jgi:hypothetical protein